MRHFFKATYSLFLLLCAAFFLWSCSDSSPELSDATGFLLLDYGSDSHADARLAVFAELSSDVHRVQVIMVTNRATGYEWLCTNPVIFTDSKKQFAGCTDFASPYGEQLPAGIYDLEYTDAQGKTVQNSFTVSFREELFSATAEQAKSLFSEATTEYVAYYNKEDVLIRFERLKLNNEETDDNAVFALEKDADYFRRCIMERGNSVLCLFPPVKKPESS